MALRPIKKKPISPRPKVVRKRVKKPTATLKSVPETYGVSKPSRIKWWTAFAYLVASIIFFSPMSYHAVVKDVNFEGLVSDKDQFFRDYLTLYEKGDKDQAVSLLSPETKDSGVQQMESMMASFKEVGALQDCHLLNTTNFRTFKGSSWEMIYYLDYEKGFGVADFKIHKEGQGYVVDKFYIKPMHQSLEQSLKFPSLLDVSIEKVIFILFGYLLILLNARTLVQCCYSPLKRKWLWIIFILAGIGSISIPLDPGYSFFHWQILSFHSPIVDLVKNPLWEPWQIRFTLPWGMVVFLVERRRANAYGKW